MPVRLIYVRAAPNKPDVMAELCIKPVNSDLKVYELSELELQNLSKDILERL